MKRDSDCSSSSFGRNPSSSETASLACRIRPSRSATNHDAFTKKIRKMPPRRRYLRRTRVGMEEGLTQAVGQIDAILAEDAVTQR
jgi:hypothetical protein